MALRSISQKAFITRLANVKQTPYIDEQREIGVPVGLILVTHKPAP